MKRIGQFLLAGNLNAGLIALLVALLPLLGLPTNFIASIIVGLVTLEKGPKAGLVVLVWVALPAICFLILGRVGIIDFPLFQYLLVWVLAVVLRRYQAWSFVLEGVTLLSIIAIALLHVFVGNMTHWWSMHLQSYIIMATQNADVALPESDVTQFIAHVAPFATGFFAFMMTGMAMVLLMFARRWQAALQTSRLMYQSFVQIRIAKWFSVMAFVIVIAALFRLSMALDCLPMVLLPFAVAGLAILHAFADKKRILLWWLLVI